MPGPLPAWYPDPHDPARLRWWDGDAWTEHVQTPPDQSPPPSYNGAASMAIAPAARTGRLATVTAPWIADHPVSTPAPPAPTGGAPPPALDPVHSPPSPPLGPPPRHDIVVRPNSARTTAKRALLVGAIVAAVAIAGFGTYSSGLLDSLTGASSSPREASSDTVHVLESSGYSFETPKSWVEQSVGSYDFGFAVPNGSISVVSSTKLAATVDLADRAVREFVFDTAARGLQLDLKGVPLTSKVPFEVGGAQGQQVVLSGSGGDGQPTQVIQTVFVRGQRVFFVAMIGHGILADDPARHAEYDAVLASFRFS